MRAEINKKRITVTKQLSGFALISLLMQACSAVPSPTSTSSTMPRTQTVKPSNYVPPSYSTANIKEKHESDYAQKLAALKDRNPSQDAHNEAAKGNAYIWIYQSGRGGRTKAPGLTEAQLASNAKCPVRKIAGLGDTIYGDTHLKYRVAIRKYANQFNKTMLGLCR